MRIYIAHKISATTQAELLKNLEWFDAKEIELTTLGHDIYNPAKFELPNKTWEQYLAEDLYQMQKGKFDAIYLGRDWRDSKGARLEFEWAKQLGLQVIFE